MVDTARARAEAALRRDATLEAVAFAAQRFLEEESWEDVVPELLRRLGRATSASRAYVFQNHLAADGTHLTTQRWEWVTDGIAPVIDDPALQSQPWVEAGLERWERVLGGGSVLQGHIRDFPESEHETLRRQQIVSILVVPIFVSGEWWGHIGFDEGVAEREWTQIEIDALRAAAGTLGAAIHRRRTEEQLREAESKYRTLVEQIPAVTYIDSYPGPGADTWPTLYMSPQIETLLGYSPQEWVANPTIWVSLLHPDDREAAQAADAAHYATGEPLAQEYRMIARGGRVVWVRDEAVVVRDEDGRPRFAQGFLSDITERRRAERRLEEAEERFRTIVEQTPAIIYQEKADGHYDAASAIAYVSPQIERILGYPAERWSAEPGFWSTIVHPDDRDRVIEESNRTTEAGDAYSQEYRMLADDGRVVWFHDEAVLFRDEEGRPQVWQGVMLDITERRLAEERFQEAERMYRLLVEHIPAVVYREALDGDPARFYMSPQVEAIFGYTPEEWTWAKEFWLEHIHPDDRERVLREDERSNETGELYSIEYRLLLKDGSFAWVHDEATLVEESGGEPFWQGFILDITERKLAESQLSQAQTRYQVLVEHLPAAIYREPVRFDPKDFYISPQVLSLFGYSPEDWRAEFGFWRERIHPDDLERVSAINQTANETGEPYLAEYRFRRKDGSYLWIRDEAIRMDGIPGEEPFWQGFLLDVTERKLAEERLAEAEAKFRLLVEQVPAAIYTQEIDPDDPRLTNTIYISPRAEEMLGYTEEETLATGGLWRDILHPDDIARVLEADAEGNESGQAWSMEYRMIAKDGRVVWIHDEAKAVVDSDGRPRAWQGFMLDITERKGAEEQLEHALEMEREASRRLRALDDMKNTFLQAVSHDLRTPLAAILGLAVTLERADIELDAVEARDLARRIASNSRKLDRMVTDLLDLDRLARGIVEPKLHPTDVGALVRRVVSDCDLVGDGRVQVEAAPVIASVDAAKVERVVENLLANTVRHTPAGTRVWVRVERADGGVVISVDDEGPGVPQELREAIFEPFRQGPGPTHSPGVGVGLALVARFAELMGGRAWVEDRDGGGAAFRVFLAENGVKDSR